VDDFFDFSVDKGLRKGLVDKLIVLTGIIFEAEEAGGIRLPVNDDNDDDDDGDDGFGDDDGAAKDALDEDSFGVIPTFLAELTLAKGFCAGFTAASDDEDD